jgi:DNA anti-recombination protein RmuC
MEKGMADMNVSHKAMADAQKETTEAVHNIQQVVLRLQEADAKHSDGLRTLGDHNTEALQTFKGMLEDQRAANTKALTDQREANDRALASLTETLTNKALEHIQANMVSALFKRVTDWAITMVVAGVMFLMSYIYTHSGLK